MELKPTGKLDRHGFAIYEGDVLSTSIASEWDDEVPRIEKAVVEFDGGRYWCKSLMTTDWRELGDYKWERIGNIHENPELAKI